MSQPQKFKETIILTAERLKDTQYAIRGTTSLVLQGLEMNVDDIDVLCDKTTALECNEILKDYLVEKVEYKKSEKFRSYYGKFKINNIQIEVYGEWEIKQPTKSKTKGGRQWSNAFDASSDEIKQIKLDGHEVNVTTIDIELKMFAAMGRWNALHKIKKQIDNPKNNIQPILI